MNMDPDDDLAEIDTTPEEYARYKAESEPARLVDPPARPPIYLGDSSVSADVTIERNHVAAPERVESERPLVFSGNHTSVA